MTPISFQDPQLHEVLAKAISGGNPDISESILNFVKNQLIPILQREGLYFSARDKLTGSNAEYPKTPQDCTEAPQLSKYTNHGVQDFTNPIKPFMMIDINAVKDKKYTPEEIFQIFEQTGLQIIQRYPKAGITFGQATQAMLDGKKVTRTGWRGKGLFTYYVPGGRFKSLTEVAKKEFGEETLYEPYFAIYNRDRDAVTVWVPSTPDCLAKDWEILD